jgi:hypothetical protein
MSNRIPQAGRKSYPSDNSDDERSVSSGELSQTEGKNSERDTDSVKLASTKNTPKVKVKNPTPEAQNDRELFKNASASGSSTAGGSADQINATHASAVSLRSDKTESSQVNQAPKTMLASQPRLVVRSNIFALTVSSVIGLSMPFIMLLGPQDLASRATWVGVAAASGLIVGSAYYFGDYIAERHNLVQTQQNPQTSPA